MNRVGAERQGRERLARLVPASTCCAGSPTLAEARGDARARADAAATEADALRGARRGDTPGTATGTAAPTSTTARRSARPQNDECRIDSIAQSLGGDLRRRRPGAGAPGAWTRSTSGSCGRDDRLILLFDPPFDTGALEPGYIKGYLPGVRENGGQYTHAATWVVHGRSRCSGRGRRACELFDLLNPIRHADDPRRRRALQGRAVRRRGRRLRPPAARRPRRLDLVHRLGRAGCTASASRRSSASAATATAWRSTRASRPTGRGFEITYRHGRRPTGSPSRTPRGSRRASATVWLDGQAQAEPSIPLADDGRNHEVRVEIG